MSANPAAGLPTHAIPDRTVDPVAAPTPQEQVEATLVALKVALHQAPTDVTSFAKWHSALAPFRATPPLLLLRAYAYVERGHRESNYSFGDLRSARRVVCHALDAFCDDTTLVATLTTFARDEPVLAETLAEVVTDLGRQWSPGFYRDPSNGALSKTLYVILRINPSYGPLDYVLDRLSTERATQYEAEMARTLLTNWTGTLDSLTETVRELVTA